MKLVQTCVAVLAASLSLSAAFAEERATGPWKVWVTGQGIDSPTAKRDCAVDDATLNAWYERLRRIHESVKNTPVKVPPDYRVRWSAGWSDFRGVGCRIGPLNGELAYEPFNEKLLKLNSRTGALEPYQSTSALRLHVNVIRGLNVLPWAAPPDEPAIGMARVTGRFGGFPIIENKFALITPPGAPEPFVPAPAELVLRRWLARREADLAGIEPIVKGHGGTPGEMASLTRIREGIERARDMLGKLDSSTRNRAVWLRTEGLLDEIVFEPVAGAVQVMWVNPQFFAQAKSRSGVYVFSVAVWELDLGSPGNGSVRSAIDLNRMMAEAIDWQALARSLP